ncbi:anthranilate phosphoribosyltransferase [Thiolapillus sp.]|uniref:anthranilate phosphoribosyltransferase n=2 Tax=Thiolapillus sp. TaxID=2017437 RepID=UPI003AF687E2
MTATDTTQAHMLMRSILQRIATGPELSKDISLDEAREATVAILRDQIDPVQAALFFIALRMKRESNDEFKGVLDGIREVVDGVVADVDHVLDIADPYDGYNRTLPAAPFLPPLLAECGLHPVSHGLDAVGPKYGVTHRHVLQAAGANVDLDSRAAAGRLSDTDTGWAYVDQASFCKPLHDLIPLRTQMIKRQVLTTVEVLAKPVMGKQQTHFVTGYVHKPYPPIYAMLARHVGFNSALFIRGVEGGIIPSLRQDGKYFSYHDRGEEIGVDIHPDMVGIQQALRAVPLPEDLPKTARPGDEIAIAVDIRDTALAAAEAGMEALNGKQGVTYDSLVYTGALILKHMGMHGNLGEAGEAVRAALDSGKAANRVK